MKRVICVLITFLLCTSVCMAHSADVLIDTVYTSPGESASDWSAIALWSANEDFDQERYIKALGNYVTEKYKTSSKLSSTKSTEWHRIALAVNALGYNATDFYGINLLNDGVFYREKLGRQGINGYIWALILLSGGNFNEPEDAINTKSTIIKEILSRQNPDGGFPLSGNTSSSDITAMAVYALSFYTSRDDVSLAVSRAVDYLTQIQNEDKSFSEDGIPNAESTAQVLIALSALKSEERKDLSITDIHNALMTFKTDDGYSHVLDGKTDVMATHQAVCALSAIKKQKAVYSNFINEVKESRKEVKDNKEPEVIEIETEIVTESIMEAETEIESECETITETSEQIETDTSDCETTDLNNNFYQFLIIPFIIIAICVIIRRRK